jgi:DNA mismatch repair protein MutL
MKIKILTPTTVNKIAAGEVIERPLSVVKELVENSLDAKPSSISITLERGGRNFISVTDDGMGINQEDLALAFIRHATSKLLEEDLRNINYLGFRGEALAAILTAAKVQVKSRIKGGSSAYGLAFDEGFFYDKDPEIVSFGEGTKFEVRDLFGFMPNKLRFLKSEQAEIIAINNMIEAFALCYPNLSFSLIHNQKNIINFTKETNLEERLYTIMGSDFFENSIFFDSSNEGGRIFGYLSLPNYNRSKRNKKITFVNKRLIQDSFLQKLIATAYGNSLPEGLSPSLVLFLEVPNKNLEVNIHPNKKAVAFEKENLIRDLVISSIRNSIESSKSSKKSSNKLTELLQPTLPFDLLSDKELPQNNNLKKGDLGLAQFQIDNKYIVSQKDNSIIIIDQHAAHERIVLENMKKNKVIKEKLLSPIEMLFQELELNLLLTFQEELDQMGIEITKKDNKLIISSLPLITGDLDLAALFQDLLLNPDDFKKIILEKQNKVLGKISCYSSIRAGRKLTLEEMNKILRLIENTSFGSSCIHGRPSYFELRLDQLNRIFERR